MIIKKLVRQIAREAGVTEPLIYYHFKSKDDLFTHIIETVFLAYLIRFEALEQSTGPHCEQIRKLIELQFDIAEAMEQRLSSISTDVSQKKGIFLTYWERWKLCV